MDIEPLMALADDGFAAAAKQQNMSVNELIQGTLVSKYGSARAVELREPVAG